MILLAAAWLAAGGSLYDQAVCRLLHERFSDTRISYVVIEARGGRVIDTRWPDAEAPVAVGSLVKPFTALAYGRSHGFRFPEYACRGAASGCWLPAGHGRVGIVTALAHSCNAYFDALAAEVPFGDIAGIANRFSIPPPPEASGPAAYVGRAGLWEIAPLAIARAYAELLADPEAAVIREGMAECVRAGTGRAVGRGLAKTGTAPCTHAPRAPGDGYAIGISRADPPALILLVRVHGSPGSVAAVTAGRMLRIVREGQ